MLTKLRTLLSGKKTYLIAILMIALGLLTDNHEMILEGLAFFGLRIAVSK